MCRESRSRDSARIPGQRAWCERVPFSVADESPIVQGCALERKLKHYRLESTVFGGGVLGPNSDGFMAFPQLGWKVESADQCSGYQR